jgi:hypothetical protein
MKIIFIAVLMLVALKMTAQPKSIAQMKTEIEKSPNSPLYVKDVLKKQFRLDTITILRTSNFRGLPDSLAYCGKIGKVYGPYAKGKVLVQILAKSPGNFNHVGQIFLDTSVFRRRFADSLANTIISRIKLGTSSFEDMAQAYSMGGEGLTKGDLGWVAVGGMIPQIEAELSRHKKGEVFKVWTQNGCHIVKKMDDPKKDTGFALLMRIFL